MYRYTSWQVGFPPKWLEFGIFLFEDRQWSPHKMSYELDSLPLHRVFFCLCPHLIYHPYQTHDGSLKSFLLACFCPFILFCSICVTSFFSSDSHSWLPDTYNSTLRFNSSFTSLGFSWPSSCSWINPPFIGTLYTESYFYHNVLIYMFWISQAICFFSYFWESMLFLSPFYFLSSHSSSDQISDKYIKSQKCFLKREIDKGMMVDTKKMSPLKCRIDFLSHLGNLICYSLDTES